MCVRVCDGVEGAGLRAVEGCVGREIHPKVSSGTHTHIHTQ